MLDIGVTGKQGVIVHLPLSTLLRHFCRTVPFLSYLQGTYVLRFHNAKGTRCKICSFLANGIPWWRHSPKTHFDSELLPS